MDDSFSSDKKYVMYGTVPMDGENRWCFSSSSSCVCLLPVFLLIRFRVSPFHFIGLSVCLLSVYHLVIYRFVISIYLSAQSSSNACSL